MRIIYCAFILALTLQCKSYAQNTPCPYVPKDLEQFGPWICPDYVPSPGMPGSEKPSQLEEVKISRSTNDQAQPGTPINIITPNFTFRYNYQPCPGDPLKFMSIAPSSAGNYRGGTYGNTRSGGTQFHDGVDIASPRNANLYSMYDGTVTDMRKSFLPGQYGRKSYGNYITIKSVINGNTVYLKYNHLEFVSSGLMIGSALAQGAYMGITGNTGNAAKPGIIPHVHIQAKMQMDNLLTQCRTFLLNSIQRMANRQILLATKIRYRK